MHSWAVQNMPTPCLSESTGCAEHISLVRTHCANISAAGNWTQVIRVTGGYTNHYTTTDFENLRFSARPKFLQRSGAGTRNGCTWRVSSSVAKQSLALASKSFSGCRAACLGADATVFWRQWSS